jgi:hypothetical protein
MGLQSARAIWGGALLLFPYRALRLGGDRSPEVAQATRLLGARHLVEAAILVRRRRGAPPRWPIAVDLVHAGSMIAVAAFSARLRRDALISATAAGLLAGWTQLETRGDGTAAR